MTWLAILAHAPAILSAAERLLTRAKSAPAGDQRRSTETRLDELEESARESATLLQEMAKQVQALVMAQEAAAKKTRAAIGINAVALVIALVALAIALVR